MAHVPVTLGRDAVPCAWCCLQVIMLVVELLAPRIPDTLPVVTTDMHERTPNMEPPPEVAQALLDQLAVSVGARQPCAHAVNAPHLT